MMDSFQGRYFLIVGAKIGLRGCIPSFYTREKGVSNKYLAFLKNLWYSYISNK